MVQAVGIKDVDAGADAIETFYRAWQQNNLPKGNEEFVKSFERSYLTGQLSEILDGLTEEVIKKADN